MYIVMSDKMVKVGIGVMTRGYFVRGTMSLGTVLWSSGFGRATKTLWFFSVRVIFLGVFHVEASGC